MGNAAGNDLIADALEQCINGGLPRHGPRHRSIGEVSLIGKVFRAKRAGADADQSKRRAVSLARLAGIGVGIDLFVCWTDTDVDAAIAAAGPHIALVRVSDHVYGDRALPCRAVLGYGVIPLDRLIRKTGFRGYLDLEVIGRRLKMEGPQSGLRGAGIWMADMLERVGY